MKNIFKIALLFLVACSPYAPDKEPLFTLQKQCMAEDLRDWVISKNTAITSLQLPISSCEKADKIIVQGSPGGFLTLTRNIFTPVANTISLLANFSANCNADIDLLVDGTSVVYSVSEKTQALRVPVRAGTVIVGVTIHTKESCPVSLSIFTEKDF